MKKVHNKFPSLQVPYRIALVGEAPGETEEDIGEPFVGASGHLLQAVLSNIGVAKTGCFVGNVCQYRPPNNDIKAFDWNGLELTSGRAQLRKDLEEFKPNIVVCLGQTPLRAAGVNHPVTSYRGSLFRCEDLMSPMNGFKCIATYHPAFVIRSYDVMPLFAFDLQRAKEEAYNDGLVLPERNYQIELTAEQIIERLDAIRPGVLVSVDIEGGVQDGITCVGIATSPRDAFICNVVDFSTAEKERILRALARVLSSPEIPKVLQNSLYDNFCLQWKWKMPIRNVVHDTMLSGWEIYPELPKGLDVQASIYTRQPYYKNERKVADKLTHYRYCCTDAAVTYEIAQKHVSIMTPKAKEHFKFNMQLLPAVNYMELRGIRYDMNKAQERLRELEQKQRMLQVYIDDRLGKPLNINSPKQMTTALYSTLGYEPQYAKEEGRKTTRLTADVKALLKLFKSDGENGFIHAILKWRMLEGQIKQLRIGADPDGRVRCSYNLVGTETGRMTCYESPTGSGANLTTIMKKNRDCYIADEGMHFFQCDLEGADGWTVAAHAKALGDDTMMLDYQAGIKPARVIAAMYKHGWDVARMSQSDMKKFLSEIEIEEWLYFVCKVIQHGSNYQMGKITMSENILLQSWKRNENPIYFSSAESAKLQSMYLDGRYRGIKQWWKWVEKELQRSSTLSCASGHVRTFFGRNGAHETIKTACSHEPQANTTYATNRALFNLWHDPENRRPDGSLIIEPLHQVHDALCGQYPQDRHDWAVRKINEYFNNPMNIAGIELTIPFEMGFGPSWKEQEKV